MAQQDEIFEGKSFEDLTKEIYDNSVRKRDQINLLVKEIHSMVKTLDDALTVAPILKEYLEVGVKNDDHLVKLASVLQRAIAKVSEAEDISLISDFEKQQLLDSLTESVNEIQAESDRLEDLKVKTEDVKKNIGD